MGLTTARIELRNPRRPDLPPVVIDALADTGADHMCIPAELQRRLALEEVDTKTIVLADGSQRSGSVCRSLAVAIRQRTGFTGAVVVGDQPLLGAIAMEDMDLVVIPRTRRLAVNPESPDIATSSARAAA